MIIHSEQEMLDFGKSFADNHASTGDGCGGGPLPSLRGGGGQQPTGPVETKAQQDSSSAVVIELIGDVGAGKTTFVRGLAEGLSITEPITSPSFTISKSYALPHSRGYLIHYDFYRLQDPGLMADDLAESIANPDNIVIIEWGESITDLLPKDHTTINIEYTETGDRACSVL